MSDADNKKPKETTKKNVATEFESPDRGKTLGEILMGIEQKRPVTSLYHIDPIVLTSSSLTEQIVSPITSINFKPLESITFSPPLSFDKIIKISTGEKDIEEAGLKLKTEINELTRKLKEAEGTTEKTIKDYEELQKKHSELQVKEGRRHILERVNDRAKLKLIEDPSFFEQFESNFNPDSVILSIDIRRSTDLMLRAIEPRDFAIFISHLAGVLKKIIVDNYGIYDKFTGDGILSFFPSFYSGQDSIGFALKAAQEAHRAFAEIYTENRRIFSTVMEDAGIGIGIDYGRVHMMIVGSDLTVVGRPVVYACRLAGCTRGTTLVNQGVINRMQERYPNQFEVKEEAFDIKHEGRIICSQVQFKQFDQRLTPPDWATEDVSK